VAADHVVRVADLGALLGRLVTEPAAHDARADERARVEVAMGARQHDDINTLGHQSPYSCPECGGVLNDIADQAVMRFRCRVGHAYTADTLVVEQEERIEDMLWAALRALEESAGLKQRMADRLREGTATTLFRRLKAGAEEAHKNAAGIRRLIGSLEKQVEQ
jgi:two-component system chemotaxis response regulator CheB